MDPICFLSDFICSVSTSNLDSSSCCGSPPRWDLVAWIQNRRSVRRRENNCKFRSDVQLVLLTPEWLFESGAQRKMNKDPRLARKGASANFGPGRRHSCLGYVLELPLFCIFSLMNVQTSSWRLVKAGLETLKFHYSQIILVQIRAAGCTLQYEKKQELTTINLNNTLLCCHPVDDEPAQIIPLFWACYEYVLVCFWKLFFLSFIAFTTRGPEFVSPSVVNWILPINKPNV